MKKSLLFVFISCFLFAGFSNAQQLYTNVVTVQGEIPGSELNTGQILFDDVEIPDALIGAEDSINITQVKISVDRVVPEADTFTLYYSTLNESGTGTDIDPSYFTTPPISIGTVTLTAASSGSADTLISFGDSLHTLFKVKTPSLEILSGQKTFFIGLQYSTITDNGWNYTNGSQSPNISDAVNQGGLWLYTPPSTVDAEFISGGGISSGTMGIQIFGTVGSLPVTFINFDGVLKNNIAVLDWSTAREYNNKGFEVEKSTDGQSFTDIGFVEGNGSTKNISNYTFSDPKMISGDNYYRLKQIDLDGNFNYSSVIKLEFDNFAWSVLGNPSSNTSVQLQLDKQYNNVSLQVVSLAGNIMQTINKGSLGQGTYSIPLNLNNMASGMYLVRLMVDGQNFSKEIVK
jgi:hypothetical protein